MVFKKAKYRECFEDIVEAVFLGELSGLALIVQSFP
jgi:hypothetical protein